MSYWFRTGNEKKGEKIMKKIFALLIGFITAAAMCLCFTACDKTATMEDIAGVWVANSYSENDGDEVEMSEDLANKQFISIKEDGTAKIASYGYEFDGKISDNGDNTFTFKYDAGSIDDITYKYDAEKERLSTDKSEEYGYPYVEYYAVTTMNALKASLKDKADTGTDSDNSTEQSNGRIITGGTGTIDCDLISIDIPASWSGKYEYEVKTNKDSSGSVTLYQKAGQMANVGGTLVTVMIIEPSQDFDFLPDYKYLGTLKQNGFDYSVVASYPTDVQYSDDTKAEYDTMSKDIDTIIKSIKGLDGSEMTYK